MLQCCGCCSSIEPYPIPQNIVIFIYIIYIYINIKFTLSFQSLFFNCNNRNTATPFVQDTIRKRY